jgi:ketosteroid isomerase-like protein
MRKFFFFFFILAIITASCQTGQKVAPVDPAEAKAAVTRILDSHWSAVKAKDADAVMALLTDDFLSCGTDPREFWNKTDLYNSVRQMLADTSFHFDVTVDRREIRIARDGNSAIAIEQMVVKPFSQKMPIRTVFHLVRENNAWLIDFSGTSFLVNNEDIEKLNKALE